MANMYSASGTVAKATKSSNTFTIQLQAGTFNVARPVGFVSHNGFYRIDEDGKDWPDDKFNRYYVWPFSAFQAVEYNGEKYYYIPKIYYRCEVLRGGPHAGNIAWFLEPYKTSENHICPSFVRDGVEQDFVLFGRDFVTETGQDYGGVDDTVNKTVGIRMYDISNSHLTMNVKDVFNIYDQYLYRKIILAYINPGNSDEKFLGGTDSAIQISQWMGIRHIWGYSCWFVGMYINDDFYVANPRMDNTTVKVGYNPAKGSIYGDGNWNINTYNGVDFSDFMWQTEKGSATDMTAWPRSNFHFWENTAYHVRGQGTRAANGFLGFRHWNGSKYVFTEATLANPYRKRASGIDLSEVTKVVSS